MKDIFWLLLKPAARRLGRSRSLSVTIVCVLSLAIGLSAAVFAVVDAVVLTALPFPKSDQLFEIKCGSQGRPTGACPVATLSALRDAGRTIGELAYHSNGSPRIERGAILEPFSTRKVSSGFFSTLGVKPALGRWFLSADNDGSSCLVVLSHRAWRDLFQQADSAVGSSIVLPPRQCEVIGVMPEGFAFPESRFIGWTLDHLTIARLQQSSLFDSVGVMRLGADASVEQFRAELAVVSHRLIDQGVMARDAFFDVQPLRQVLLQGSAPIMWFLLANSYVLLVIVAVNVIGLLVTRSIRQSPAQAMRLALGASSWRLRIEHIVETLLLAPPTVVGAVLVTRGLLVTLEQVGGSTLSRAEFATVNVDVVLYIWLVTAAVLGTSGAFGFISLQRGLARPLAKPLAEPTDRPWRAHAFKRGALAVQAALGLILVLLATGAAGLLREALGIPLGFQPKGLVAVGLDVADTSAAEQTLARVRELPSIHAAAVSSSVPLASSVMASAVAYIRDEDREWQRGPAIQYKSVSTEYFHTVGIGLRAGRLFVGTDHVGAPCVAVVSEGLAGIFGDVAAALRTDLAPPRSSRERCRIVGVVADVRDSRIRERAAPQAYFHYPQQAPDELAIVVRASDATAAVRELSAELVRDGQTKIRSVVKADEFVAAVTRRERTLSYTVLLFSVCGYVISILGLLAAVGATLAERRRELAVRVALGASRISVSLLVIRSYIGDVGVGLLIGGVAYAVGRDRLPAWLTGITPIDGSGIAGVGLLVWLVVALTGLAPMLRLRTVDLLSEFKN